MSSCAPTTAANGSGTPTPATLADVIAVLDGLYPPSTAAPWDAVGLVCGDPQTPVRQVLFAVDPVAAVAAEAVEAGVDLLVTHHPLFLRAVHGVPATTPKGRVVHQLVTHGVALHVAHTNADGASPGVSDALSDALGLPAGTPLEPAGPEQQDKLVTFCPRGDAEALLDALSAAGAGVMGDYVRCAWTTDGVGTFHPQAGAQPAIGAVGEIERVRETRIEILLPRARRSQVIEALWAAHPYEEPAFDIYETAATRGARGIGRVCRLPTAEPLGDFVERVRAGLPATPAGVRVAGDIRRPIRTVAVCGGAGDSLLGSARNAGADVYLTADLRHHPASEALEAAGAGGPALVDVAHWASEWPWLGEAARLLRDGLAERRGDGVTTVGTRVSSLITDPWTQHRSYPEVTR